MLFSDTIIEKDQFFVRNLITTALAADVWSTASSGYGMFNCPYEIPLIEGNVYYMRYTYKFTTTNQSPTWVQFYTQSGSNSIGTTKITNPVAGTEYTASGIGKLALINNTLTYGTIYNGDSGAISGVSSQVKNVLFYDVTELYYLLQMGNLVHNETELKTWCDNNLGYSPPYTNYNITALVGPIADKVFVKGGAISTSNFVEADGMRFYSFNDTIRNNTYFDTGLPFGVYNNSGGGTVTLTRINGSAQNSPFYPQHQYICQITTNGTASPGAGGFVCQHTAAANKIFIERFVAKVPTGYTVNCAYNSQGTGNSVRFITPQAGTGNWEEYAILYRCGTEGSFSTGGHVYISGSNNTSVTWYVAYVNNCDITSDERLMNFSILKNKERIKENCYFSNQIDNLNLIINNASTITDTGLPSTWQFDTIDYMGNTNKSIVQPVGAVAGTYGIKIPIRSGQKYKVSYWVKCKQDMTSFLTAIRVFIDNNELTHAYVNYKAGTKTRLSATLNTGDTQMIVQSNANWGTYSYSRLGFRTNSYRSWNDKGISNGYNGITGLISGTSGSTIVTFNTAYTGSTMAANTYVVEAFDGGTYPYPISKGMLPTDNTWKYVEGYFGDRALWDGNGGGWTNLPYEVTHIMLYLNIYTNDGTVPIKYSDIRIEPVAGDGRYEKKLQIIGG